MGFNSWIPQIKNEFPYDAVIGMCPPMMGCICDPKFKKRKMSKLQKYKFKYERLWKKLVDGVWCVNLKERADRLHESAHQFHMYGLCRLVRYYHASKPTDDH